MVREVSGAHVYILKCSDGSYYTGLTKLDEPEGRVWEHNNKIYEDAYTATRLPVTLVFAEHFESILDAIASERRIKKWSRAKKEALIMGDWQRLILLAKRRSGRPKPK
jgi:putative endonuclease